MSVNHT